MWRCTDSEPKLPEQKYMSAKFWRRLAHECELWQKGLTLVAGADEAGCVPLARAGSGGGGCVSVRMAGVRTLLEAPGLNDSSN